MSEIMLGNLSIEEIQKRVGVDFPNNLINYLADRKDENAQHIARGKWHCFDIPFVLLCGDTATAKEIYNFLSPLSCSFKRQLEIAVNSQALH